MSMLIIGVNPPKSCYACSWYNKVECPVNDGRYYYRAQRHPSCPLVEIPTPHGRLIDVDAHILEIRKRYCDDCSRRKGIKNGKMKFLYEIGGVVCRACEIEDMLNALDDAPTVIEAEGREE